MLKIKKVTLCLSMLIVVSVIPAFGASYSSYASFWQNYSSDYQNVGYPGNHNYTSHSNPNYSDTTIQLISGAYFKNYYYLKKRHPNAGQSTGWAGQYKGSHYLYWTSPGQEYVNFTWSFPK